MIEFGKQGHYTWSFSKRKKSGFRFSINISPFPKKSKTSESFFYVSLQNRNRVLRLIGWSLKKQLLNISKPEVHTMIGGVIGVKDIQTEDGFFRADSGSKNSCSDRSGQLLSLSRFFLLGVLK
jgi:hypothetical protein